MKTYSLTHLGDRELLRNSDAVLARDCGDTAELLAHIAEIDARKLFLQEGFPSMHEYCVQHMHLCEDAAYKRIHVARAALQFPAIFEAVASGRLHLTAVRLLAPYLTAGNADGLLAAAVHKSKAEIQRLLAERYPRSEMLSLVQALPGGHGVDESSVPGPVARLPEAANVRTRSKSQAPEPVGSDVRQSQVTPLAPGRVGFHFSAAQSAYERMRYALALLGHELPAGEIPEVFELAMDALIEKLEKRKFAATYRPRSSARSRHIPAEVKRTVWERDGGQCSFVSESGQPCPGRRRLEFDHIEQVARGGEATVGNLRLVCRGHNQYEAERTFGAGFMSEKREAAWAAEGARRAAEVRRQEMAARAEEVAQRKAEEARAKATVEEIVTPLRLLGCRADQASRIAATCATMPDAPLEERLRFAIKQLAPPHRRVEAAW